MTSISTSDAVNFSASAIPGRYFLDHRPTSQLFRLLPFVAIDGHKLQLNSVSAGNRSGATVPDPLLYTYADAEAAGGALNATMPSSATIQFPITRLAAELQIDGIISGLYGSHNNIVHELIRLKVEAIRDHFKALLFRGDSLGSPGEFDGLAVLTSDVGPFGSVAPVTRTITANGGAGGVVQSGEIEQLMSLINPRESRDTCYLVMHAETLEHLRRNNYTDVEYLELPHLGLVSAIAGVPILIDNFIPIDETVGELTTTSVYALILGENIGLCGIYPSAHKGDEIQVRGPYVKDTADRKYYHVTWDVGLACFNSAAVARLAGVAYMN